MTPPASRPSAHDRSVLITGGAGFVGANLADRFLSQGLRVRILDNLSRPGVEENLEWLRSRHGEQLHFANGDVRDSAAVQALVTKCGFVYHLAAQVAVTTSLREPIEDFTTNLAGTLNVLEAIRLAPQRPPLMFASTNKVYGSLSDVALDEGATRYVPVDADVLTHGFGEDRGLNFLSPYGCSKGAADQYVLDYSHSYGLTTVVLRMSCIYGPRQQGSSDQGWVAHFLDAALRGEPLTIYGNGKQVRDVLYIDDFVTALCAIRRHAGVLAGRAYNIGGGPANTLSLLELIESAGAMRGSPLEVAYREPRVGDQQWFVADHRQFSEITGWRPETSAREGTARLWDWLEGGEKIAPPLAARAGTP